MSALSEILIAFAITATLGLFSFLFFSNLKRIQRRFDDTEKFGRKLGHDVEGQLSKLREDLHHAKSENELLRSRIQNLETIVTSHTWDVMTGDAKADIEPTLLDLTEEAPEPNAEQIAAQIARRIR